MKVRQLIGWLEQFGNDKDIILHAQYYEPHGPVEFSMAVYDDEKFKYEKLTHEDFELSFE